MANLVSRTIPDEVLNRIIQIESAGKPLAKASTSSATGFGQFLSQTWLGTLKKHAPRAIADRIHRDKVRGKLTVPDGGEREILNMRLGTTKALQKFNIDMLARFTEDNAAFLGAGWTPGDLYLAHFLGTGDARDLLRAPPATPVSQLVSQGAIAANRSILAGKTAGQVRAWAAKSMDERWIRANKPDWIAKYWFPGDVDARPVPIGEDRPPVKVEVPDEPKPPHGEESKRIEDIQARLKEMGYHEVGEVDGKWGGRTAGAIGAFKNDRHLAGAAVIDDDLIAAVVQAQKEGFKRSIAPERREATEDKLEEKLPEVKEAAKAERKGLWTIISGALSLAGSAVVQFGGDVVEALSPVKTFFGDNAWVLFALGGIFLVAVIAMYLNAKGAKNAGVEAYREGERT